MGETHEKAMRNYKPDEEEVTRLVLQIQSDQNAESRKAKQIELWENIKGFVEAKVYSLLPFSLSNADRHDSSYESKAAVKQYYAELLIAGFKAEHIIAEDSEEKWQQPYIYQYIYNATDNIGFCAWLAEILKHPFAIYEPKATRLVLSIQKCENVSLNKKELSSWIHPFLVFLMKSHKSALLGDYAGSGIEEGFVDVANDFAARHISGDDSNRDRDKPYVYKYNFSRCDSFCGYVKKVLLPASKKNGEQEVVWENFAKKALKKIWGNPDLTKTLAENRVDEEGNVRPNSEIEKKERELADEAFKNEQAEIELREFIESRPKYYAPYLHKVNNLDWDKILSTPKYTTYVSGERIVNEHKIVTYHLMFILSDLQERKNPHIRDNAITRKFTSLLTEPGNYPMGRKSLDFWRQKASGLLQSELYTSENLLWLLATRIKHRGNGDVPLVEDGQNIREAHLRWIFDTMAPRLDGDYRLMKKELISGYIEGGAR